MSLEYPDGFTDDLSRRGICGILAVAIAANVSYDKARAACKLFHPGKRLRGRTWHRQRMNALWSLGVRFVETEGEFGSARALLDSGQLKRDTLYMLRVNGHAFCSFNGCVADQNGISNIAFRPGLGRKKVTHIVEIVQQAA